MSEQQTAALAIYTIGHSNHPLEHFIELLRQHGIEVLVDVRSHPSSKYVPHFNRPLLEQGIKDAGMKYLYLGKELGGRPDGDEFYDAEGHARYDRVAASSLFLSGISRLEKGIQHYRVAMMCAEEDPAHCHRHLLVSRVLATRGIAVRHIRGDGKLQAEEDLVAAARQASSQLQLALFDDEPEEPAWRSIRSVLPKDQRGSSSEH